MRDRSGLPARADVAPLRPAEPIADFIAAMGEVASSVTVVTTDGAAGRFGQTVTAMSSVCAEPPVLLIGLFRGAPVADAVRTNACFAVNVLDVDDEQVARDFAGQAEFATRYKFDDGWGSVRTGSPVRLRAVAAFDCHVEDMVEVGTHVLVIGRVVEVRRRPADPLTYRARTYGRHLPAPLTTETP